MFFRLVLFSSFRIFRYRIVSARAPRIATEHSPQGKTETADHSPLVYRIDAVLRAGGCKPAAGRGQGRYKPSVKIYRKQHDLFDYVHFSHCAVFCPWASLSSSISVRVRQLSRSFCTSCILQTVARSLAAIMTR